MTKQLRNHLKRMSDPKLFQLINDAADIDQIGQSVCSFLNTNGGSVFCLLHLSDLLPDQNGFAEQRASEIEIELKGHISPLSLFTVSVDVIEGCTLIVIEVTKGKDQPYVYQGAVWIRKNNKSQPADIDKVRELILSQTETPERWERLVSPAAELESLDFELIKHVVDESEKRGKLDFGPNKDVTLALRRLSLWSSEGITNAGDVLFGANPAKRHPQCRVQFTRYRTDKTDSLFEDQEYFEGPLMTVTNLLYDKLSLLNERTGEFEKGALNRADRPSYPPDALREAVVNAVVHRDYSSYSGGVKVSVYPSRIEVWNSGRLPTEIKLSELKSDHGSFPRNPDISHVFYICGFMERVGRGTEMIYKTCRELGARAPTWKDQDSGVTLTLYSSVRSANADIENLNERQLAFLNLYEVGQDIRVSQYHREFGVGIVERQARRDLVDLMELGLVTRIGAGPSTKYRVDKKLKRT